MPLSRLKQFICHILYPVLDTDDDDIFSTYQQTSESTNFPWFASWAHFSNRKPQIEVPRPEIGGTRITVDWLKSLNPRDCLYQFRLYADELVDLAAALQIPEIFRTSRRRYTFPRVEALALLLARFKTAGDQYELSMKYYRSQAAISELINELCVFLDNRWSHLLDFDSNGLLAPARLQEYADAIHARGAPLDAVWGFLDCTIRGICRPCDYQRIVYNGYKKLHAIKYQAVKLPNGLIGHLFGPIEGRRNDNALLAASHLLEKCAQFALRPGTNQDTPVTQRYFQLFGDPAYGISPILISPFQTGMDRSREEMDWNYNMSHVRMEVEHGFGEITREWPFLNAWWKLRVFGSPVGRYYRVCVLLTNALNCIRPNQTSQAFQLLPPYIHEYFHD